MGSEHSSKAVIYLVAWSSLKLVPRRSDLIASGSSNDRYVALQFVIGKKYGH